jgi:NADH-quinone oxidoreductase subunit J
MNEIVFLIILISLVLLALMSVMIRSLIKAAIALALTSAVLAIVMFMLHAWIAAVIELSVCAGMITVVFVSAISLTRPLTEEEIVTEAKHRMRRFIYLPFILVAAAVLLYLGWQNNLISFDYLPKTPAVMQSFTAQSEAIWNKRQIDIIGQVIVIFAGVFGVVVLFKERIAK